MIFGIRLFGKRNICFHYDRDFKFLLKPRTDWSAGEYYIDILKLRIVYTPANRDTIRNANQKSEHSY